jgi:molybdopterin molybdotransferase
MAQLSSDALAFGGALTTLADAVAGIAANIRPVPETEAVALAEADGRVLAEPLIAPIDLPPWDNSAVDGYAVRFADLAPPRETRLPVAGRFAAGDDAGAPLAPGTAARIFTGAPMPPGADTVFMQEDVRLEAGAAVLPAGLAPGANARRAGEDLRRGAVALEAGRRLRPEDVGLAAALGVERLTVRRRLNVAVLSTGNELARPGEALRPGRIHDANRPMLAAMARRAGANVRDLGLVRDDPAAIAQALERAAADADLVLTSGGVSTGEEDHVKGAVERAGRLDWWRVGIKPGRPVALGVVAGAAFAGLPGNPVAAFVTFARVVRPLLAALAGETWRPPAALPVRAGFAYKKKTGRREFVRVRLSPGEAGLVAVKHAQDGAGVITSLTASDGLVELPEDVTRVAEGDVVGFVPFSAVD